MVPAYRLISRIRWHPANATDDDRSISGDGIGVAIRVAERRQDSVLPAEGPQLRDGRNSGNVLKRNQTGPHDNGAVGRDTRGIAGCEPPVGQKTEARHYPV